MKTAKVTLLIIVISIFCSIQNSNAQPNLGDLKKMFARLDSENVSKPFKGITTSEGLQKDLFPIKSTGVSTKPVKKAAEDFLQSLNRQQLAKAKFLLLDKEWQQWCNVDNHLYSRKGISLKEMSTDQRVLAYNLIQKALSAKGLLLTKDIMKTDQTLSELNGNDPRYDEELYFFTIMGTPSLTDPWGWQLEGHHLAINYFMLKDQVVMTPVFMGGEPIITTSGKYKGNTLFQDEQNVGLKLMQSFSEEQRGKATISKDKGRNNIQAEAFSDNKTIDFKGLSAADMNSDQKEKLISLVNQYISNMDDGHAKVRMEEVTKHLDNTWFSWIGKSDNDAVFYYRIYSPVILIEFDHQGPVGIRGESREATRNHIHTIVRTPNGNDYGKDLLRQHLADQHNQK